MGEITKVYLQSKIPMTPDQKTESLADILKHAEEGFMIELQREVFAHTAEETFEFLIRKIEPDGKFYGTVDKDTIFEIMHNEPKVKPPKAEQSEMIISPLPKEDSLLLTEVDRLKPFIDELETLRNKYVISWGCLRKLVEAIDEFGGETAPML